MKLVAGVLPVVILLGLTGNTISFMVLVTPQMRKTSVYFYLTVLSISDSTVLIFSAFKTWLRNVSGFEFLHHSNAACKLISFTINFSYHVSAWIVVLVTVDRFVAVWLPLRSMVICTVSRARTATGILLAIMFFYNTHILFIYSLHPVNNATHCQIQLGMEAISAPLLYTRLFTYCVIPFFIILILNILIDLKLRNTPNILTRQSFNSKREVEALNQKSNQQPSTPSTHHTIHDTTINTTCPTIHTFDVPEEGLMKKLRCMRTRLTTNKKALGHQVKLTQMLFAICVAWILLTLPYSLCSFFISSFSPDPAIRSVQMQVKAFCYILFYANHSINFFLYCLVGKKFRTRLKALFCSRMKLTSLRSLKTQKSNLIEMDKQHQNQLQNHKLALTQDLNLIVPENVE